MNEENKTVACKLNGRIAVPEFVRFYFLEELSDIQTVGVAKCSDEDTFDINKGKKIALSKAENKAFIKANRLLKPLLKEYGKILKLITEYEDNSDRYIRCNKEYISKLGNRLKIGYKKDNNHFIYHNGCTYVDLGLPSGTKWGVMNIGAENETDYGLYFAWGETKGYTGITEEKKFIWDDYKYGTESNLTKYNTTDGLTTLEPSDDAATVNWGGKWRMPTVDQFNELLDPSNCTNEWVEDYDGSGVNGRLFTSVRNSKTLFFPAAGYCYSGSLSYTGVSGYFWSCALSSGDEVSAQYLYFGSGGVGLDGDYRVLGFPVRGVLD